MVWKEIYTEVEEDMPVPPTDIGKQIRVTIVIRNMTAPFYRFRYEFCTLQMKLLTINSKD